MTEPSHAVFLSYASQDAEAAESICEALRAAGIEVWFDQSELRGGDAWDRKIRDQIRHCALFMPLISAHSQARLEGYFRREWKIAVERKRDIADELAFLLPVVIDETPERGASVPEGFHEVQWTRLPGGAPSQEFIQHVSRLLTGHQDPPKPAVQALQPSLPPAPQRPAAESKSASSRRMWMLLIAAAAAAIVAYISIDRYVLHKGTQPSAASATATMGKSIAVLPFADLSEKHDQEYFADGLADEVLDQLAKIPGLKVIARTSSFRFKGTNEDLHSIATQLGAAHILEGSVRVSGNRIRVTAQLIRAADEAHEWSDSYDRDIGDALQIQREIAANLARILQVTVADTYGHEAQTVSPAAQDLYLRGRHAYSRFDKAGLEEAAAFFQQALDLDPSFSNAAYMRALTHMVQADNSYVLGKDGWDRARREAEALLGNRLTAADGHGLLARIYTEYDWNWTAAQREIDTALAVDPDNLMALYAENALALTLGQWSKAETGFRAYLSRDPLDPDPRQALASVLYGTGRFSEAAAEYERAIQLDPTFAFVHVALATDLIAMGKVEAALKEVELESPDTGKQFGLACVYFLRGKKNESGAILSELTKESANDKPYEIALAHECRGELDETFKWLDRAYAQKDYELSSIKSEEVARPRLRADSRWAAFLRKMNLPP